MLYFDRTDIPGGIDVNKTIPPKEFNVYHYQHFLGFKQLLAMNIMTYYLCLWTLTLLLFQIFMVLIIVVLSPEIVKVKP